MKVLTVIDSLILAGAEALVKDTVPRMRNRGVDVTVAVLQELPRSTFERDLRDQGIPFLPTAGGGLYSPAHIFSLAGQMGKFDIVHVRLFPAFLWVPLAQRFSGKHVPLVMSADTTNHNREKLPFARHFESWIHSQYTAIAAASEGIADVVKDMVPRSAERVRVVWNGIDLTRFRTVRPTTRTKFFDNDDPFLIYTARSNQQKDHATLIQAMSRTKGANLLLVGEGPLRMETEALATSLKLSHRIRFLGRRPDIPELLKSADIYVHVPLYEGFGIAVIEAMAAGLPVIASDVVGLAQVVGEAGVLVKPQDPEVLAKAIHALLNSPERRKELTKKAVRRAADFDIENTVSGYIGVYEKVLSGEIPAL
jgi:glycosyltransferase involved in cell wall biosynthesis